MPGTVLCKENIKINYAVSFLREDIVKKGEKSNRQKINIESVEEWVGVNVRDMLRP